MPSTLVIKRLTSHFMVFTLICVGGTLAAQAAKQRPPNPQERPCYLSRTR